MDMLKKGYKVIAGDTISDKIENLIEHINAQEEVFGSKFRACVDLELMKEIASMHN